MVFALTAAATLADELVAQARPQPTIGLVLAGGGAKGIAHVGVIKVLEQAGVHVDLVVGTSMGAIVGGLYAMGLPAVELESIVKSIDWNDIFIDDTPRRELTIRRKTDDFGFLADPRLRLKDGEARLPLGAIQGQRLTLELRKLTAAAAAIQDFDKLPIPFRAIAADIETGEEVVLAGGELAMALRASMSVAGAFPPVVIDGRTLIDGGVLNNIPVNVARDLGADIVIVASFAEKLGPADELTSPVDVMRRMMDLMVLRGRREQIASLSEDDILIVMDLGDLGFTSFDRTEEAVALGEASAKQSYEPLARLALPGRERPRQLVANFEGRRINRIVVESDTTLSDEVLRARMRTRVGDPLDTAKLEDDISRIYGLGQFETVTYALEPDEDGAAILVVARENPAGKNHIRFGIELQTDFDREANYNIGTRYTAPGLNELNGEWRSDMIVGNRLGLISEFYQPLDPAARFFVGSAAAISDRDVAVFKNRKKIAETRVLDASLDLRVGTNLSDDLTIFGVASRGIGRVREVTGTGLIAKETFETASLGAGVLFDDLDDLNFPRQGSLAAGQYIWSPKTLGADQEFHAIRLTANGASSWGDHTFALGQVAELTVDGESDISRRFELGGPFRVSGLLRGALTGDNALLTRVIYYQEVERFGPTFLGLPLYAGASLEYGNVFDAIEDVSFDDMLLGGSLFVGADTYVGPLYLGYGYTEGGSHAVFLIVGGIF